jgi:STE24 endopeptidase
VFPYEFDPGARERARAYQRGALRGGLVGRTIYPMALALAFLVFGFSRSLANWAEASADGSRALADALYIIAFALLFGGLTFPVAFYLGFLRERRWGMSRRRLRDFGRDSVKGVTLALVTALLLLLPFFYLARRFEQWWLLAAALYTAYLLFTTSALPNLLLRVFYKLEPVADAALRDSVVDLANRCGVKGVRHVVVLKESARSPRANAFVHGVGPSRRVVLLDTLVDAFHPREVRFVLAHEFAHIVHRDVLRSLALTAALVFPEMWALSLVLQGATGLFGVSGAGDVAVVPLLVLALALFGVADTVAISWVFRRHEARADAFALEVTQDPAAAESMLKRLCDLNLVDDTPHPLRERLFYSHPPLRSRIDAARRFAKRSPALSAPPSGQASP